MKTPLQYEKEFFSAARNEMRFPLSNPDRMEKHSVSIKKYSLSEYIIS